MTATAIYYTLIIIVLADFFFEKWLDYLNDREKQPELPPEAAGIYDASTYAKWLAYDKANNRLSLITSLLSTALMLLALYKRWFGQLDVYLRQYVQHPVSLGLMYFAILGIAAFLLSLPFGIYSTFVIEERFGFNKTSAQTYVKDIATGTLLGLLLGVPLGGLIIYLFIALGDWFWLAAWGVLAVFSVFMTMFAASLIMPLFNKFTPLEAGDLRSAIEDYCQKAGFRIDRLFVMDGSKRSAKSNAFFSGLGPRKTIALYDTLIDKMTTEEIVAVLAHEIGHYKKRHTRQSLLISLIHSGLMLFLLGVFLRRPEFSMALGAQEISFHTGLIAFGIAFSPISTLIGIGMNILSRRNEYEADAWARETYSGEALATALKKLTAENLSNLKPHPYYVFVHYSHPPILSRLRALYYR